MSKKNLLKFCNVCHKNKPQSAYRKRKHTDGGGYYAVCKHCKMLSKMRRREKKTMAPGVDKNEIDLNQPLELDFLNDLQGWTADEIKLLLLTVKKYAGAPYRMNPRDIFRKHFVQRTVIQCGRILAKFKMVAANDIKFEDYMNGERKYRKDGKRIVYDPKKSGKK